MAPMTNAERQKKYRQKLKQNSEQYEEKKKRHREYMRSVRQPIRELSEDQQVKIRLQWKAANEKRRENKLESRVGKRKCDKVLVQILRNKCLKLSNKLKHFKEVVDTLSRQNTAFKKQIYRLKKNILQNATSQSNINSATVSSCLVNPQAIQELQNNKELTPMTRTNTFIQENLPEVREEDKERVKKKILELNVIKDSINYEYYKAADNQAKNVLKNLAINHVAQKYNMKTSMAKTLGLKGKIRKPMKKQYNYKEAEQIRTFFNRDDNSRMSAGKNECITHKKSKKQKRYLLQNIKKLYIKYVSEGGKASESTFRRNKLFYVVRPKLSDRDTCACLRHSNLLFKAQKLHKLGILATHDLEELVISVSCSTKSYNCMYSNCIICKGKSPPLKTEIVNETECSWLQWELQEHKYSTQNNDGTIGVNKTKKYVKAVKQGTVSELTSSFLADLEVFKKHFFNIQHQYAMYRETIDNLKEYEAGILIDFSENYQCKMSKEIQSLHFGASRVQITLHTGIIYTKCQKPKSFVSVSPSNDHCPGAIWAHLEPVIDLLKKDFPEINVIHFFSDGPSTQYKQKKNFYQMCKLLEQNGFDYGTWSFFESAHGKGAADGVGGAVKRVMDQQVAYGRDIFSAMDAANTLKENTNIEIFYIPESKIKDKQSQIPGNLVPIPGTMRIHQIVFHGGKLSYRDISCCCGTLRGVCGCYNIKTHELEKQPLINPTQQRPDTISNNTKRPKTKPKNKTKSNKSKPKINRKRKISEMEITDTDTDSSNISYANTDDSPYILEMSDEDMEYIPIYQGTTEENTYNLMSDSCINDINASLAVVATPSFVNCETDSTIPIPDQITSKVINDVTATTLQRNTSRSKHPEVLTNKPATRPKYDKRKIKTKSQTSDSTISDSAKILSYGNSNKSPSALSQSQITIHKPQLSPLLQSPGSLQGYCIDGVNKQLFCENSNLTEKGTPKEINLVKFKHTGITEPKKHWDSSPEAVDDFCNLRDISKSNQFLPIMARPAVDIPSVLKIRSGSSNIKILSNIVIKPPTLHDPTVPGTFEDLSLKKILNNKCDNTKVTKGRIATEVNTDSYSKQIIAEHTRKTLTLTSKQIEKLNNINSQQKTDDNSKRETQKGHPTNNYKIRKGSNKNIRDFDVDDKCGYGINTDTVGHGLFVEDAKTNRSTDGYTNNDLGMDENVDHNNYLVSEKTVKNKKTEEILNNDLKSEETENNKRLTEYFLNDHVLFRYYNRNRCTYYIGLIESIHKTENDEPLFMVKFLKTIKKPKLVFRVTKIVDRAEISQISIVKKVDLVQNPVKSNEYILSEEDNTVYF